MKPLKPILSSKIYFPGLITLVFLPLFCIVYLFENGWFVQKSMLNVFYYNDAINKQISKRLGEPIFNPDLFRKYNLLNLTGDEKRNDLMLSRLINQNRQLKINKDTVHGYLIHFSKHTKYADVVKTFTICDRDSIGLIYGDNVYFFWVKPWVPPKGRYTTGHGGLLYDDIVVYKTAPTFFETLKHSLKRGLTLITPFWPCLIPFVGMIYFWRKRNKWGVE